MNRSGKRLGRAALALGVALLAAACSAPTAADSSSSDGDLGGESVDGTATKTPRPTTPANNPNKVTPPPPVPANACAQQLGDHACFDCCNQASGDVRAARERAVHERGMQGEAF